MTQPRPIRAAMRNIGVIIAAGVAMSGEPAAGFLVAVFALLLSGFFDQ